MHWQTKEDVKEDIKQMGIRCRRRRTQDRQDWASVIRQTLVLEGAQGQRERERERERENFAMPP